MPVMNQITQIFTHSNTITTIYRRSFCIDQNLESTTHRVEREWGVSIEIIFTPWKHAWFLDQR